MEITMCCNKMCPFTNKCYRYIDNYPDYNPKQLVTTFDPYDPDLIKLSKDNPQIFNPDKGGWEPEPMCFGPLLK